MSSTEGTRAWEYLRRNPDYVEAWRTAAEPAPEEPAPFPLRAQTAADREAAAWGLLAWEDPDEGTGAASPFWADASMLEAVLSPEAPALAELLKEPEVRLSGLHLAGGAAIVRVECGEGAVQIRIADGAGFDPAGGIDIRLPTVPDLRARLRRTGELWPIGGADTKTKTRPADSGRRAADGARCETGRQEPAPDRGRPLRRGEGGEGMEL